MEIKKNREEKTERFGMGEVLIRLQRGKRMRREGWNGKGMWIQLQMPGEMTVPYIYMKTADNNLVPWLASQTDILANDWSEV